MSVIIPVYNVERFIVRCATSLMEQSCQNVEYIFIDDATADNSIALLRNVIGRYPDRIKDVKIVSHATNLGLPAARNTGLGIATGEYVFHCDSDDFVDADMLSELYSVAKISNADIVWCDWFLSFKKNERYMKQPEYTEPIAALKAMLCGIMKFNVWNKLVRRNLYIENNICFPSGYGMGEDMTMLLLFAKACHVTYLPKAFYHYVQLNTNAFSKTYSERHLKELQANVIKVESELKLEFGDSLEEEIAFFKLNVKFPFLISDDFGKYALWKSWYPEANKYIMKNKQLSLRSRCLQWLAMKNQFWAVSLYYKCVHRLIYGVIFR